MTVMVAEVYDALLSAGAAEDKARKAAEAVAESRTQMQSLDSGLRSEMQQLRSELRSEMQSLDSGLRSEMQSLGSGLRSAMQSIRGEMNTVKWLLGALFALAVAMFLRVLFV